MIPSDPPGRCVKPGCGNRTQFTLAGWSRHGDESSCPKVTVTWRCEACGGVVHTQHSARLAAGRGPVGLEKV